MSEILKSVALLTVLSASLACQASPPRVDPAPILVVLEQARKAVEKMNESHRARDEQSFTTARDQVREHLATIEGLARGDSSILPTGKAKLALRDGGTEISQHTATLTVSVEEHLVQSATADVWLVVFPELAPQEAWVQAGAVSVAETSRGVHLGMPAQAGDQWFRVALVVAPRNVVKGEGMMTTRDLKLYGVREIADLNILRRGNRPVPVAGDKASPAKGAGKPEVVESVGTFRNQILTTKAWQELEASNYDAAIAAAEACIAAFGAKADEMQVAMKSKQVAAPPTGSVDESTKQNIHKNGLLNDVATCHFVVGKANEELRRYDAARQAYTRAKALDYARCWDNNGWFWSPAEGAVERLTALQGKK